MVGNKIGFVIKPLQSYFMMNKTRNDLKNQGGYTLSVILLFISALAVILTSIAFDNNKALQQKSGVAAGESLAEIARAARIFVRNQSLIAPDTTPGDPFHRNRLAITNTAGAVIANAGDGTPSTGPNRGITVANLIAAKLLPTGYGFVDGGGIYRTAQGHEIRIIAANVPVVGDPTIAGGEDIVSSAYIYIIPGAQNNQQQLTDIVTGLRKEGVSVSSVFYDAAGNNTTTTICRGNVAVAVWDTGCLNDAEFSALTGAADPDGPGPQTAFRPGSLIIPAWRSAQFDLRAVMRYPQPENPGYATMLTNLNMAEENCAAGNILINDDTGVGAVDSGICQTLNDLEVSSTDRRFDLRNIRSLDVSGVIITEQVDDVVTYHDGTNYVVRNNADTFTATGRNNDEITNEAGVPTTFLSNGGFMVNGDTSIQNDVRVYDDNIAGNGAGITFRDVDISRNLILNNPDAGANSNLQPDISIGTLSTDTARVQTYNQDAPGAGVFDPNELLLDKLVANSGLTITSNLTAEQVAVRANNLIVNNDMTLSGSVQVNDVTVTGGGANLAGGYNVAIANLAGLAGGPRTNLIISNNFEVTDDSATNSAEFNGSTTINNTLNVTNGGSARCLGIDCPDRCPFPVSPLTGGTICP